MNSFNRLHLFLVNLKMLARGRGCRFSCSRKNQLFVVEDSGRKHYFANRKRGLSLYKRGLAHRAEQISNSYLLNHVDFEPTDVIIDCGANYGDLYLYLKDRIPAENYIGFEPGAEEFRALQENIRQAKLNNAGLSNTSGTAVFYVNSQDADSSLIQPSSYTGTVTVKTVTLADYVTENKIEKIKLLKLEAEGFEPEILEGAESVLHLVEYIAIDGGRERGVNNEETFSFQTNFLIRHGFEMIEVNFKWGRALFRQSRNAGASSVLADPSP